MRGRLGLVEARRGCWGQQGRRGVGMLPVDVVGVLVGDVGVGASGVPTEGGRTRGVAGLEIKATGVADGVAFAVSAPERSGEGAAVGAGDCTRGCSSGRRGVGRGGLVDLVVALLVEREVGVVDDVFEKLRLRGVVL